MKISNINFKNIKISYFNNALKPRAATSMQAPLNSRPVFDTFKGNTPQAKKEAELYNLINDRVKNPEVITKKFSQYTGDDYEVAKILAASMKENKDGLYFSLSKEDKQKIKWLKPECPYLQAYMSSQD